MNDRYPNLTTQEKAECLDLGRLMEKVKQTTSGRAFVIDLLLVVAFDAGLVLVDKDDIPTLVNACKGLMGLLTLTGVDKQAHVAGNHRIEAARAAIIRATGKDEFGRDAA